MAEAFPTRFTNLLDLARLPYFEVKDGRDLVLTDPDIGPVIDVHTHLALSYLFPAKVDLYREAPMTEHYLPRNCPIDLDIYINKNFLPEDLKRMTQDLVWKSVTGSGMRASHTVPNLTREMKGLGITHAIILPIDYPFLSSNTESYLEAASRTPELISFASIHPMRGGKQARLEHYQAEGAKGVKVHPAVQVMSPDTPKASEIYEHCGRLGLPVLFHCGPVDIEPRIGRMLSQVWRYERPLREFPQTTFVLGHSGALQMEQALVLSKEYPNVYLDLSCQSLGNVRKICVEGDHNRLLFGSDWPFYHQAIPLAKVLMATENDKDLRRKILFTNAVRMLKMEV